jgi:hypothetical protein
VLSSLAYPNLLGTKRLGGGCGGGGGCQQEIEDIKHGLESGSIAFNAAKLKFSDEAILENKDCIRIPDEKVTLATQTYGMVSVSVT